MPKLSLLRKQTLKTNFTVIKQSINKFTHLQEVCLVAVSKNRDYEDIKELYFLGQRDFGESYVQELCDKMQLAKTDGLDEIRWHFIGNLQSNKIKFLGDVDFVHSISSLKKAQLLNQIANKKIKVFLQVNLNNQENRSGFSQEEILKALPEVLQCQNLEVKGFMCILPLDDQEQKHFLSMLTLKKKVLAKSVLPKVFLSMGMSNDYEIALQHGANYLRIGSRIFN